MQTVACSAWSHGVPVCHQLMAASWMVVVDKSVQLPTSADSVTLLAFAAERRPCSSRLISPARPPCRGVWRPNDGTDGRTDRRTPYHYIDPTPPNMPAVPLTLLRLLLVVEWFPHRTVIKCQLTRTHTHALLPTGLQSVVCWMKLGQLPLDRR